MNVQHDTLGVRMCTSVIDTTKLDSRDKRHSTLRVIGTDTNIPL